MLSLAPVDRDRRRVEGADKFPERDHHDRAAWEIGKTDRHATPPRVVARARKTSAPARRETWGSPEKRGGHWIGAGRADVECVFGVGRTITDRSEDGRFK